LFDNLFIFLRFIRDKTDPESLSNKKNSNGETPLYMACKNGYLNVFSFNFFFEFLKKNVGREIFVRTKS